MLELPKDWQDPVALADWLELSALEAGDSNASVGDLKNVLGFLADTEKAEELALEVVWEIEERVKGTGEAYPFDLRYGRVLEAKTQLTDYIPYLFCLILSYFGWTQKKGDPINPRLLFEELCCLAAKEYIQGDAFQFGTGRRNAGVSSFGEAVKKFCRRVGEGQDYMPRESLQPQDDHVDLVAWRDFRDRRPSKLILFGQCATGANWRDKVSELHPTAFWGLWMVDANISPLVRSFYIPHRIPDEDKWRHSATYGGILFDRCRVSYWAWMGRESLSEDARYENWCKSVFPPFERIRDI